MRQCSICKEELTTLNQTPSLEKTGHLRCKFCKRKEANQYYKENTEQVRNSNKKYYHSNLEMAMLDRAKRRASQKGWNFNIELEDIIIPETCPIFGVPLVVGRNHPYSPSLDRIDSSKGYIKGNIQVISRKANTIKSDATAEEVMLVAKYMEK